MAMTRIDLLQGTLDLLIRKRLALGPLHGWGIAKRIQQISKGMLPANQGLFYPTLYGLEHRGWIGGEWGVSPKGRRPKFYAPTQASREQLAEERASWRLFARAVEAIPDAG